MVQEFRYCVIAHNKGACFRLNFGGLGNNGVIARRGGVTAAKWIHTNGRFASTPPRVADEALAPPQGPRKAVELTS